MEAATSQQKMFATMMASVVALAISLCKYAQKDTSDVFSNLLLEKMFPLKKRLIALLNKEHLSDDDDADNDVENVCNLALMNSSYRSIDKIGKSMRPGCGKCIKTKKQKYASTSTSSTEESSDTDTKGCHCKRHRKKKRKKKREKYSAIQKGVNNVSGRIVSSDCETIMPNNDTDCNGGELVIYQPEKQQQQLQQQQQRQQQQQQQQCGNLSEEQMYEQYLQKCQSLQREINILSQNQQQQQANCNGINKQNGDINALAFQQQQLREMLQQQLQQMLNLKRLYEQQLINEEQFENVAPTVNSPAEMSFHQSLDISPQSISLVRACSLRKESIVDAPEYHTTPNLFNFMDRTCQPIQSSPSAPIQISPQTSEVMRQRNCDNTNVSIRQMASSLGDSLAQETVLREQERPQWAKSLNRSQFPPVNREVALQQGPMNFNNMQSINQQPTQRTSPASFPKAAICAPKQQYAKVSQQEICSQPMQKRDCSPKQSYPLRLQKMVQRQERGHSRYQSAPSEVISPQDACIPRRGCPKTYSMPVEQANNYKAANGSCGNSHRESRLKRKEQELGDVFAEQFIHRMLNSPKPGPSHLQNLNRQQNQRQICGQNQGERESFKSNMTMNSCKTRQSSQMQHIPRYRTRQNNLGNCRNFQEPNQQQGICDDVDNIPVKQPAQSHYKGMRKATRGIPPSIFTIRGDASYLRGEEPNSNWLTSTPIKPTGYKSRTINMPQVSQCVPVSSEQIGEHISRHKIEAALHNISRQRQRSPVAQVQAICEAPQSTIKPCAENPINKQSGCSPSKPCPYGDISHNRRFSVPPVACPEPPKCLPPQHSPKRRKRISNENRPSSPAQTVDQPRQSPNGLMPQSQDCLLVPQDQNSSLVPQDQHSSLVPQDLSYLLAPKDQDWSLVPQDQDYSVVPKDQDCSTIQQNQNCSLLLQNQDSSQVPQNQDCSDIPHNNSSHDRTAEQQCQPNQTSSLLQKVNQCRSPQSLKGSDQIKDRCHKSPPPLLAIQSGSCKENSAFPSEQSQNTCTESFKFSGEGYGYDNNAPAPLLSVLPIDQNCNCISPLTSTPERRCQRRQNETCNRVLGEQPTATSRPNRRCGERQMMSCSPKRMCEEQQTVTSSPNRMCGERQTTASTPNRRCGERRTMSSSPNRVCEEQQTVNSSPNQMCGERQTTTLTPNRRCRERRTMTSNLNRVCEEQQTVTSSPNKMCDERQTTTSTPSRRCGERQTITSTPNRRCGERQTMPCSLNRVCEEQQTVTSSPNRMCGERRTMSSSPNRVFDERRMTSSNSNRICEEQATPKRRPGNQPCPKVLFGQIRVKVNQEAQAICNDQPTLDYSTQNPVPDTCNNRTLQLNPCSPTSQKETSCQTSPSLQNRVCDTQSNDVPEKKKCSCCKTQKQPVCAVEEFVPLVSSHQSHVPEEYVPCPEVEEEEEPPCEELQNPIQEQMAIEWMPQNESTPLENRSLLRQPSKDSSVHDTPLAPTETTSDVALIVQEASTIYIHDDNEEVNEFVRPISPRQSVKAKESFTPQLLNEPVQQSQPNIESPPQIHQSPPQPAPRQIPPQPLPRQQLPQPEPPPRSSPQPTEPQSQPPEPSTEVQPPQPQSPQPVMTQQASLHEADSLLWYDAESNLNHSTDRSVPLLELPDYALDGDGPPEIEIIPEGPEVLSKRSSTVESFNHQEMNEEEPRMEEPIVEAPKQTPMPELPAQTNQRRLSQSQQKPSPAKQQFPPPAILKKQSPPTPKEKSPPACIPCTPPSPPPPAPECLPIQPPRCPSPPKRNCKKEKWQPQIFPDDSIRRNEQCREPPSSRFYVKQLQERYQPKCQPNDSQYRGYQTPCQIHDNNLFNAQRSCASREPSDQVSLLKRLDEQELSIRSRQRSFLASNPQYKVPSVEYHSNACQTRRQVNPQKQESQTCKPASGYMTMPHQSAENDRQSGSQQRRQQPSQTVPQSNRYRSCSPQQSIRHNHQKQCIQPNSDNPHQNQVQMQPLFQLPLCVQSQRNVQPQCVQTQEIDQALCVPSPLETPLEQQQPQQRQAIEYQELIVEKNNENPENGQPLGNDNCLKTRRYLFECKRKLFESNKGLSQQSFLSEKLIKVDNNLTDNCVKIMEKTCEIAKCVNSASIVQQASTSARVNICNTLGKKNIECLTNVITREMWNNSVLCKKSDRDCVNNVTESSSRFCLEKQSQRNKKQKQVRLLVQELEQQQLKKKMEKDQQKLQEQQKQQKQQEQQQQEQQQQRQKEQQLQQQNQRQEELQQQRQEDQQQQRQENQQQQRQEDQQQQQESHQQQQQHQLKQQRPLDSEEEFLINGPQTIFNDLNYIQMVSGLLKHLNKKFNKKLPHRGGHVDGRSGGMTKEKYEEKIKNVRDSLAQSVNDLLKKIDEICNIRTESFVCTIASSHDELLEINCELKDRLKRAEDNLALLQIHVDNLQTAIMDLLKKDTLNISNISDTINDLCESTMDLDDCDFDCNALVALEVAAAVAALTESIPAQATDGAENALNVEVAEDALDADKDKAVEASTTPVVELSKEPVEKTKSIAKPMNIPDIIIDESAVPD